MNLNENALLNTGKQHDNILSLVISKHIIVILLQCIGTFVSLV